MGVLEMAKERTELRPPPPNRLVRRYVVRGVAVVVVVVVDAVDDATPALTSPMVCVRSKIE
eukprot:scaffold11177_cov61-Cylindrotheca_fusiformis.AAC.1